jgi:trypsin
MNLRNIASVLGAVGSKEEKSTRVIGGRESTEGRYSYAVSLADDLGSFCGASLIAPDIVLSAAHCAGGDYHVIIGRHDLDVDDGDEVEIKKEIVHPRYDTYTTDNDFMVLVLVSIYYDHFVLAA